MPLTAKKIEALKSKPPGRYLDGRGLYLQVTSGGASWILRYEIADTRAEPHASGRRERFMGLGSLATFDLKEARERARNARQLLADGIDPLEQKKVAKAAKALAAAKTKTFTEAAQSFFDEHSRKWSNAKHTAQFTSTMKQYVLPVIGALSVAEIDTGAVLKVLEQHHADYPTARLWDAIPETANRVRGRIEQVLDWATVRGYRTSDNPARWKGFLSNVLPARSEIQSVQRHPALPYADVSDFMAALRKREGVAALALEFTILTAARTGAVIGALRSEIDFENRVWNVPVGRAGSKTKAGDNNKPRRIPLSDRAIEILRALPKEKGNPHLFIESGKRLPDIAMTELMVTLAFPSNTVGRLATVHGFRSTFKDWVSETTNYANHVSEAALWHTVADQVEAAYRRGDLFEKRRKLMVEWARYCAAPKRDAAVIPIRKNV